ncbi:MAG: hypothetical protein HC880_18050 [Bacteroidia bacterium]|nr:hypothetical protein [Bacteroidia bacterium]
MDKKYNTFFEKILAIQNQRREKLNEAEKKAIALELGLSEEDWQAVLQSLHDHMVRAERFLERNNYLEAQHELAQVLLIRPEHPQALAQMAWIHLQLAKIKNKKAYRQKAVQYAKEALQYDTTNPLAYQVLDEFNVHKTSRVQIRTALQGSYQWLRQLMSSQLGYLLFFVLGVLAVGWFSLLTPIPSAKLEDTSSRQTHSENDLPPTQTYDRPSHTNNQPERKAPPVVLKDNQAIYQIPVRFSNQHPICKFEAQPDGSWMAQSPSGRPLFLVNFVKSDWALRTYPEYSPPKYRVFYEVQAGVKILANDIQRSKLYFNAYFKDKNQAVFPISGAGDKIWFSYVPPEYVFEVGETTGFRHRFSVNEMLSAEEMPFSPEEQPAYLEFYVAQFAQASTPSSPLAAKAIPIFYQVHLIPTLP